MTAARPGWMSADRGRNDTGVRVAKFALFGRRPPKMPRLLLVLRVLPVDDDLRERRRSPGFVLRSALLADLDLLGLLLADFDLLGLATCFLPRRDERTPRPISMTRCAG